jgi:hypothetical protein
MKKLAESTPVKLLLLPAIPLVALAAAALVDRPPPRPDEITQVEPARPMPRPAPPSRPAPRPCGPACVTTA